MHLPFQMILPIALYSTHGTTKETFGHPTTRAMNGCLVINCLKFQQKNFIAGLRIGGAGVHHAIAANNYTIIIAK